MQPLATRASFSSVLANLTKTKDNHISFQKTHEKGLIPIAFVLSLFQRICEAFYKKPENRIKFVATNLVTFFEVNKKLIRREDADKMEQLYDIVKKANNIDLNFKFKRLIRE